MKQLKYLVFFCLFILLGICTLNAQEVWIPYRPVPFGQDNPDFVMPVFPNGNDALLQFIKDNMKYPEEALKKGIEGRVVLRFTISRAGSIKDLKIVRSLHSLLDKEAIRIVSIMPRWIPGMKDGKPADIEYTLPILFRLSNGKKLAPDNTNTGIIISE